MSSEQSEPEKSQFERGHRIPVQHQEKPGLQADLKGPQPRSTQLPTEDGGYQTYKAAGKLLGKKALITGGDSGIGRAVAILFAMEGAEVCINYLTEEEKDAQETKKRVEAQSQKCHLYPADIRDKDTCRQLVDNAIKAMGGIDILVNNAAYQHQIHEIKDLSEDQWLHTFDVNIHPFFYLSKYTIPHMKPGSSIINCGSINPYVGRSDLLDYTSTKGAITAFSRALANQLITKGIRVNTVCPGPVWTPLIPATMGEDAQESFASPMGRPGQPSEIAPSFVFLASQDSSLMSGQALHPNGGTVLNT